MDWWPSESMIASPVTIAASAEAYAASARRPVARPIGNERSSISQTSGRSMTEEVWAKTGRRCLNAMVAGSRSKAASPAS